MEARSCGTLLLHPPFQVGGELRLSSRVLTEIAERRLLPSVPLAFLFADDQGEVPPDRAVRLGHYSREHQVWVYAEEVAGSDELVPPGRRVEGGGT